MISTSYHGRRGARALSQPMFLMSALRAGDDWDLLVQGSRGTNYHVHMSPESVGCTCPDFMQRHERCKHVFFVAGRVLGDTALMNQLEDGCEPAELFAAGFSSRLERRLRERLGASETQTATPASESGAGASDDAEERGDTDCVVCFEPLQRSAWQCHGCKRTCMHGDCASRWFRQSSSCPLCRAPAKRPVASLAGAPPPDSLANFKTFFA